MTTKTKRIKHVFSNAREVLHLWANQTQDDARSGNVFFIGKSCYSYGHHYELGRIIKVNGQTVALINTSGYSPTTGKHISYAKSAVPNYIPTLNVDHDFDVKTSLLNAQGRITDSIIDHFHRTGLTEYFRWDELDIEAINDFNKLCKIFKRKELELHPTDEFIDSYNDHVTHCILRKALNNTPEALAVKVAEALKREEKKQADILLKSQDILKAWKSGVACNSWELNKIVPQQLRIKGKVLETTGGVRVDLDDAKVVFASILKGVILKGERILDGFTFNGITDDILTIGCHRISIAEAKTLLIPNLKLVK